MREHPTFIQIAYTKDTDRSVVDKLSPPELEQFLQWYANENEACARVCVGKLLSLAVCRFFSHALCHETRYC